MKILHLNTNDINGGAARAANRLHKGLLDKQVYSRMMVLNNDTDDNTIMTLNKSKKFKIKNKIRAFYDKKLKNIYPNRLNVPWSCNFFNNAKLVNFINNSDFDIVHLHWINDGMISIDDIEKIKLPIIWTMHDMWPFTGGCHYSRNCKQYENDCKFCKQLAQDKKTYLSKFLFQKKTEVYKKKNIFFIAPSNWLADCAARSKILHRENIFVIPNGINLNIYKNINKYEARKFLGLEQDKKYILFGAENATTDKRKGYDLLFKAMTILENLIDVQKTCLLVFGSFNCDIHSKLKTKYLGKVHDDIALSLIYNSSDVFVAPSREDNLPNTIVEAISCGLPTVAFNVGGITDIIEHGVNGYLANPFDENDLSLGIKYVLENDVRWEMLSKNATIKSKSLYDINIVSQKYINMYNKILKDVFL